MSIGLFDIMGPITIGPSSSHTAGAVRIGLVCRMLLEEEVKHARITFYGSFADTYHGHGTDKAVVGGLLGFQLKGYRHFPKYHTRQVFLQIHFCHSSIHQNINLNALHSGSRFLNRLRCFRRLRLLQWCIAEVHSDAEHHRRQYQPHRKRQNDILPNRFHTLSPSPYYRTSFRLRMLSNTVCNPIADLI